MHSACSDYYEGGGTLFCILVYRFRLLVWLVTVVEMSRVSTFNVIVEPDLIWSDDKKV